jgi:hypothetical protein
MPTIRKRGNKWQAMVRRTGAAPISRTFSYRADAFSWAMERELQIERCDLPKRSRPTEETIEQLLQTYLRVETPKKRSASREQGLLQSLFAEPFLRKPMAMLQNERIGILGPSPTDCEGVQRAAAVCHSQPCLPCR